MADTKQNTNILFSLIKTFKDSLNIIIDEDNLREILYSHGIKVEGNPELITHLSDINNEKNKHFSPIESFLETNSSIMEIVDFIETLSRIKSLLGVFYEFSSLLNKNFQANVINTPDDNLIFNLDDLSILQELILFGSMKEQFKENPFYKFFYYCYYLNADIIKKPRHFISVIKKYFSDLGSAHHLLTEDDARKLTDFYFLILLASSAYLNKKIDLPLIGEYGFDTPLNNDTKFQDSILKRTLTLALKYETESNPKIEGTYYNSINFVPKNNDGPALLMGNSGIAKLSYQLSNNWNIEFEFDSTDNVNSLDFFLSVGNQWKSNSPVNSTGVLNSANLTIEKKTGEDNKRKLFLGNSNGLRLEIGDIKLEAKASLDDIILKLSIKNCSLIFTSSDSEKSIPDTLIQTEALRIDFNLGFRYSWNKGFSIDGGSELTVSIPIHSKIGIIELQSIIFALKATNDNKKSNFELESSVNFKLALGPLILTFERVGLSSTYAFENLGKIGDFNFGFKSPNGVGISINTGGVIGGGFLSFNEEKSEYIGALEILFLGEFSLKAIGLITTKMPDGSKGFSMLIIITAEFIPAFQLGFGFTLMGVGGLLGLNRTVRIDPLRDSVRTGAVNNILFPQNVIANAPRIISDLNTIFPTYEGKFLIGPMAKIGWGTPTLISLSLGLIIEIPGNIAILGVLRVTLPEERLPLVKIQIAFVGIIDFDKKMFSFDASLFESSIIGLTLEGDMAVRLKWGDSPDFLLTVGGFHPSFTPPPLSLPTLRRLAISILNESYAKIRVECYLAVTSNTVQFGAKAELFFGLSECSINGYIGFDALFQFNPFYFIIDLSAGFSLSAFGMDVMSVSIRMSLEGPTPWVAKGTGSISLFFFDISADFNETWGDSKKVSLPDIAILPRFIEEIKKNQNWSTALSTDKNTSVTLRKFKESENIVTADDSTLIMHPSGTLVIQQKLLPLNINIVKIGNQKTSDVKKIDVFTASSNGNFLSVKEIKESYAIGQYQELSNAEKLSKPSFQKETGGIEISFDGNSVAHGKMVRKVLAYELTIIDKEPVKPIILGRFYVEFVAFFTNFLRGNSISKSSMSKNYMDKLQPISEKLKVNQEGYSIVNQANNTLFEGRQFSSEMAATSFYQDILTKNPSMKSELQVVPNFELQES